MKRCRLADIRTVERFYDELARQLDFPPHFGRNLDALWDVLTTDIEGPVEVVWEGASQSHAAMGEDFVKLAALLEEVTAERGDFTFTRL
ncbi:MAG: barstar family protein [Pseudomonadota bacterium]|jgi:ribonuclease inhibitor